MGDLEGLTFRPLILALLTNVYRHDRLLSDTILVWEVA
jgi:hypothetical protein